MRGLRWGTLSAFCCLLWLSAGPTWAQENREEELDLLREQVSQLTEQLKAVQEKLDRLQQNDQQEKVQTEAELLNLRQEVEELREEKGAEAGPGDKGTKESDLQWDFGGQYRVMLNVSNFPWHPATIGRERDRGFANQRLRTWLWVSPIEPVEGYVQVELGHIPWGENFEWTKTYAGPRFPASVDPSGDRVGIELRRGHLTYRHEDLGDFRIGIQDFHDMFYASSSSLPEKPAVDDYDSFGSVLANSIWDFNVGGLTWWRKFPECADIEARLGWYALMDEGGSLRFVDAHLTALDLDLPLGDDSGIGFSAYYLRDSEGYSYPTVATRYSYRSSQDLWVGLRGHTKLGDLPLNGFIIFNQGSRHDPKPLPDFYHTGLAAKVEAGPYELGPGKLSGQVLVSTGENDETASHSNEFRTIGQSERDNFGAQGFWSYLLLSSPHGPSDVNDLGVGLQNQGYGLFTIQAKYDYPIFEDLGGTFGMGWLRSFTDNQQTGHTNMGFEFGNTFALDLGGGMGVQFGGAFMITGDFYKERRTGARHPYDLWETFARFQLEF